MPVAESDATARIMAAVVAAAIVGCAPTGNGPQNIDLLAEGDSLVRVTWQAPASGSPDGYLVFFRSSGTSQFKKVADSVVSLEYVHDPAGLTGQYRVGAQFGGAVRYGATVSSTPIHQEATTIGELNSAIAAGYGWRRIDGVAHSYTMTSAASARYVDIYMTNFARDLGTTPYFVAGPQEGTQDPGSVVPPAPWQPCGVSALLDSDREPLPAYSNGTYFNYVELAGNPAIFACRTSDGYYAVVKVSGIDNSRGTARVESWFQTIQGLRLLQH
jgi:hypothetical protein